MGNQYTHVNLPGRLRSRELFFEYLASGHIDVGARLRVPTRNGEGGLPGVPSCIICSAEIIRIMATFVTFSADMEKCSASATPRRIESRLRAGDRLAWWYRAHQMRYGSRPPRSKSKEVVGLGQRVRYAASTAWSAKTRSWLSGARTRKRRRGQRPPITPSVRHWGSPRATLSHGRRRRGRGTACAINAGVLTTSR